MHYPYLLAPSEPPARITAFAAVPFSQHTPHRLTPSPYAPAASTRALLL